MGTSGARVAHDETLDGLDSNLSPAVAVGVGDGGETMVYAPVHKETACSYCCEFRPTIRSQLIRDAKCDEYAS